MLGPRGRPSHERAGRAALAPMTRMGAEPKPPWRAVPEEVRRQVEGRAGSPVARAVRIRGGYAPSPTFRLALADARRLVVKGVDPDSNEYMRRALARTLGAGVPRRRPRGGLARAAPGGPGPGPHPAPDAIGRAAGHGRLRRLPPPQPRAGSARLAPARAAEARAWVRAARPRLRRVQRRFGSPALHRALGWSRPDVARAPASRSATWFHHRALPSDALEQPRLCCPGTLERCPTTGTGR
jgi:hypothetical protein